MVIIKLSTVSKQFKYLPSKRIRTSLSNSQENGYVNVYINLNNKFSEFNAFVKI